MALFGMNCSNSTSAVADCLRVMNPDPAKQLIGGNMSFDRWEGAVQNGWLYNNFNGGAQQVFKTNYQGHVDFVFSLILKDQTSVEIGPQTTLVEAAKGAYNASYTKAAQNIKALLTPGRVAYVRPANEFNGTWFLWGQQARANPADFIAAWRQLSKCFKDVFGADFGKRLKLNWCFNKGEDNPEKYWPGSEHVHVITIDSYASMKDYNCPVVDVFDKMYNTQYGFKWLEEFGKKQGRPIGISETAIGNLTNVNHAQAVKFQMECAPFIDEWIAWMASTKNFEALVYFNRPVNDGGSDGQMAYAGVPAEIAANLQRLRLGVEAIPALGESVPTPTPTPTPTPSPTPTPTPGNNKMQWNQANSIGPVTIEAGKLTANNYARVGAIPGIAPGGSLKFAVKIDGVLGSVGFWTNNHVLGIQPYHVGGSPHSAGIYQNGDVMFGGKVFANLGTIVSGGVVEVEVNTASKVAIFKANGKSYSLSIASLPAWTQLVPAVGVENASAVFTLVDAVTPTPTPTPQPTPTPTPTPQPTTQKVKVEFENGEVWTGTLTKVS